MTKRLMSASSAAIDSIEVPPSRTRRNREHFLCQTTDQERVHKYLISQASLTGEDVNSAATSNKISYPKAKWQGEDAKCLNFKKKPPRDKKSGMLNALYDRDDSNPAINGAFVYNGV